jgi:hypothetical protein
MQGGHNEEDTYEFIGRGQNQSRAPNQGSGQNQGGGPNQGGGHPINAITVVKDGREITSCDEGCQVLARFNGVQQQALCDSGSSVNVISKEFFSLLQKVDDTVKLFEK